MGMTASQARYLSLQARMSDLEYEGQQINQQRVAISNLTNAITEQLYNMEVPTAPSKTDYKYDVYTGKGQNGKPVTVKIKNDGDLAVTQSQKGTVVELGGTLPITNGRQINATDLSLNDYVETLPAGQYVKGNDAVLGNPACSVDTSKQYTQKDFVSYNASDFFMDVGASDGITSPWTPWKQNVDHAYFSGAFTYVDDSGNTQVVKYDNKEFDPYITNDGVVQALGIDPTNTKVTWTQTNKLQYCKGLKPLSAGESFQPGKKYVSNTNATKYASAGLPTTFDGNTAIEQSQLTQSTSNKKFVTMSSNGVTDVTGTPTSFPVYEKQVPAGAGEVYSSQRVKWDAIKNVPNAYLVVNGVATSVSSMSESDIASACNSGQGKVVVRSTAGSSYQLDSAEAGEKTNVGGAEVMSIAEAQSNASLESDSTFNKALSGLKNTYPDEWESFSVIISSTSSGKAAYSFCKTADLSKSAGEQIQVYNTAEGEYDSDEEIISSDPTKGQCTIDPETGHITSITMSDGFKVKLTYGQEVDEEAYDAAMNKYNYKKAQYDEEQNELNKKTSIYQRQDKMLELKLTRLDTERNALNTEMDAVKKVIGDSVEKGFKTFSG